jgi:hypothetical protein
MGLIKVHPLTPSWFSHCSYNLRYAITVFPIYKKRPSQSMVLSAFIIIVAIIFSG